MQPTELLHSEQRRASSTYLVNQLRKAVFAWRESSKVYFLNGVLSQLYTPKLTKLLRFVVQNETDSQSVPPK